MNDYRYILTPYKGPSTRHRCPSCNQPRKFSLYIDKETGEPLADHVGRCDREDRCGYHYTPRQYFIDNPQQDTQGPAVPYRAPIIQAAPRPLDYLPLGLVEQSRRQLAANHLWQFFAGQIGEAAANEIFEKYRVGTSKHWPGATAFWQIDDKGKARQCKVILYNPTTGRRVKQDGQSHIAFMGKKVLGNPNANLQQCLFGSHLLSQYPGAPVAIVESEKTALYCAYIYPNLVWLATGGKQGFRWTDKAVFEPLRGRAVVLFPDLMATADWQAKAEKVKAMVSCKIYVSTDLEAMATDAEKAAGLDLMDYLLRDAIKTPQQPQESPPQPQPANPKPQPSQPYQGPTIGPHGYPVAWDEPGEPLNMAAIVAQYAHTVQLPANRLQPEQPAEPSAIVAQFAHTDIFKPGKVSTLSETETGSMKPTERKNQRYKPTWDIEAMRAQLLAITPPVKPVQIGQGVTISNPGLFINSHLQTLEANNGNPTFTPYFERLSNFISHLTT
jgi:hypothetical protein